MKRFLFFTLSLLCLALSIKAQSYYYYRGTRQTLTRHPSKVVAIAPKANNVTLSPTDGFHLVNTISDTKSNIKVYSLSSTARLAALQSDEALSSVQIQPSFLTEDGKELYPNGYLNVQLRAASDFPQLQTLANLYGCEILSQNEYMPLWYNLRMRPESGKGAVDVANVFYETGKFAAAFPSFSMEALEVSYDADVYKQWGLYNADYPGFDISISRAWGYATGRGITIAIVDNGIDVMHQDLAANMHPLSYDTETKTSPSKLYGDHGTHCAGIAAAVRNNGIQVAGVAPDAKLMAISNTLKLRANLDDEAAYGINWAWKNGADIISCSWWCYKNELLQQAIDSAVTRGREGKGCIFVKSAGNDSGPISYPGNYSPMVLAVANMSRNGNLVGSSNYGPNMFVTAPGDSILSTIPGDRIEKKGGTSMAAPHVAGLAALILERNPRLTAKQVHEIIARTAKKIGPYPYDTVKEYGTWNERYGYGLIDAYEAVINTPRN